MAVHHCPWGNEELSSQGRPLLSAEGPKGREGTQKGAKTWLTGPCSWLGDLNPRYVQDQGMGEGRERGDIHLSNTGQAASSPGQVLRHSPKSLLLLSPVLGSSLVGHLQPQPLPASRLQDLQGSSPSLLGVFLCIVPSPQQSLCAPRLWKSDTSVSPINYTDWTRATHHPQRSPLPDSTCHPATLSYSILPTRA